MTKKLFKIILAVLVAVNFESRACTPIPAPTLLSQSVASNSLQLNWQTNTIWTTGCQNVIDVEIACLANPFTGSTFSTFTTAVLTISTSAQNYPVQLINLVGWCPGAYKFRARERNIPAGPGTWSSTFTFSIPGTFTPPVLNLQSSNLNICPPQSTTLTALVNADCGSPPYTYSWSPGGTCSTCSNTIVSPTVTTTYTAWVSGGQLSCWTVSNTITVFIGPIPPVIGPAVAFPPSVCNGASSIVGLTFYNGTITWQSASTPTGSWSSVPNGNGYNFVTPNLTTNMYYRALVQGCILVDSSNVVLVSVIPNPTVVVPNVFICPGQTATITPSGASSYVWSTGAFPTGLTTGGAAPLNTTNYTVTGVSAGCTGSAVVTVSVGTLPLVSVSDQTVCYNQNLSLTATGGAFYDWRGPLNFSANFQSPLIFNATTQMSGQYSVTVTSSVGCTNTGVSNVTVLGMITPTIHTSSPICNGSSISFTGSGASSYTWTGPNSFIANTQNPVRSNVSFGDGGIYSLIGGVGACTGTTTIFLLVLPPPNLIAQNSSPVCNGFPVSFTALGGVTYTWSGPSGFLSGISNPTISNMFLNNAGGYTLSGRGSNNCVASIVSNVTVNPQPIIPINNPTVCFGAPLNLVSGGGLVYLWRGPNNFTSALQNPVITNSSFSLSGQYSVSVTSAAGCSNTAVNNVTVVPNPPTLINSVSSICVGSVLSLNGSGATTYSWNGPNNFFSNITNPSINAIGILSNGIYTLTGTSGLCTTSVTKSITVLPLPSLTVGTPTVCETRSLQLTAIGGATNEWYAPGGTYSQSPVFTIPYAALPQTGNYTVVVTGTNGCVTTTVLAVSVFTNPIVSGTGATVCAGQPAFLQSSGGTLYNWSGPGFISPTANTGNAFIPIVNNNTIGTYIVTVAAPNSCSISVPVQVGLIALPVPTIVVTPTVCFNSEVNLGASGGISYQWDGPYGFRSTEPLTTFTASSMGLSGTYTLTAFNISGCAGFTTTQITVQPRPDGLLNSDNQKHCVPFCSEYSFANQHNVAILNAKWQIENKSFFSQKFSYCFFQPGDYLITCSLGDINGCANTITFVVNAHESPKADFSFFPDRPVEVSDEVQFINTSKGNRINKWSWSFVNNSGTKSEQENVNYYFANAGVHPVSFVVKNTWNCADTITKPIVVDEDLAIYVPNSFTPNDDGKNETFQPIGRGVATYVLIIFNRWGEKLFETNNFYEGWDGNYRGEACKSEVYQWRITASNRSGKVKDLWGKVNLYR
jgi:gliding motility-associated-like protein